MGLLRRFPSNFPVLHNIISTTLVLILPKTGKNYGKKGYKFIHVPKEGKIFVVSIVTKLTITQ